MKKITLILLTSILFYLSSCRKEQYNNYSINKNTLASNNYKFKSNVRVFDNSEKYFIDLTINSNNEDLFKEAINEFKKININIINNLPDIIINKDTINSNQINETNFIPSHSDSNIVINFNNISIGKNSAFSMTFHSDLTKKENAKNNNWSGTFSGNLTINVGSCNWYYVYANFGSLTGFDYISFNNNNTLISQQFIPQGQQRTFSGVSPNPNRFFQAIRSNFNMSAWTITVVN